jgi:RNA polymerase sigma-70 factor (ECF subfamily)
LQHEYLKHLSHNDDAGAVLTDLMKCYGKDVWSYAYVMTQSKDASDDLLQEVFLKAYRQVHTFRGESSVKTWLLSITRNESLNYLKSAFIRKVTLVDHIFPKRSSGSAEQELLDRLRAKEIWSIVLKLPVKYREIILLEAHYEYTELEMAQILGVSRGTVKSRLHRARAKVETAIKEANEIE